MRTKFIPTESTPVFEPTVRWHKTYWMEFLFVMAILGMFSTCAVCWEDNKTIKKLQLKEDIANLKLDNEQLKNTLLENKLISSYESQGKCDELQGVFVVELIGCRYSRWSEGFIADIGVNRTVFNQAYVGAYATFWDDNHNADKDYFTDSCLFRILKKYNVLKEN